MPYTTINKSSDYFNTKIYTGNESAGHAITGVGFKPDFTWFKNRGATDSHSMYDIVRGVTKQIEADTNGAETTESTGLASFDSDGFTVGTRTASNSNNMSICSWNWLAGGSQGSSNTDGTINTTYTSANTTSGFSISKYTGTGSAATIGHGLGAAPQVVICKQLNSAQKWINYHKAIGAGNYLHLNETDASASSSTVWNNTDPTSSVFSVGTAVNCNQSSGTYVAYCFAEKKGFSKFGSYTGNGSTDGTFVYTGFKPAFVIIKGSSNTENWHMFDNKRDTFNPTDQALQPNTNAAEFTETNVLDFLSNGFKLRISGGGYNGSGVSYIYMAFAEAPFVGTNNTPATAR
jgi:hypothetical protein